VPTEIESHYPVVLAEELELMLPLGSPPAKAVQEDHCPPGFSWLDVNDAQTHARFVRNDHVPAVQFQIKFHDRTYQPLLYTLLECPLSIYHPIAKKTRERQQPRSLAKMSASALADQS
jgi:hypothetical protein